VTRAAVYLRISEDRTGEQLGVTRHRQDCEALCRSKGWTTVEYLDNDTSATSTSKPRPAYQRMLADIEAGAIGAVVCWDLDRLHRRPIELESFMALADEKRIALASVSGDVDLSTAQGRLVARLKGSVAAHEGEHKKARQLSAHRQRAEVGIPNWTASFGYLAGTRAARSSRGDIHQPDPVTAPLVRQAYADILAGASLNDVCRQWNNAGALTTTGRPWVATSLSKFLRKPRNAGLRTYTHVENGERVTEIVGEGNWPALVDESTWRSAQTVLDAPERRPGRKAVRRHLLTGVALCGKCGNPLCASWHRDGRIIYVCKKCHGISILSDNLLPIVYAVVAGRLAMPDAVDLLKAEQHDTLEAEQLRVERAALLAELDNIGVERADGLLTGKQAKIATDRIGDKLTAIEARQHDQEKLRVFDGLPLGEPEVSNALASLSPDRFRAVLDVLATITVAPVGKGGKIFNPQRVQVTWK
jgi:DNA invertase Pin-like site-specific DNA recombinase